ncbi:MAG: methyltransferase family protein [Candidatus Thorarchaeota archaeon]
MVILTIIFEILFIINFPLYWAITLKVKQVKIKKYYTKFFAILWTIFIIFILLLTSNIIQFIYKENLSYFQDFWAWFLILGIIFIIAGFKITSIARKLSKEKVSKPKDSKLTKYGIYKIIRHPNYLSWFLIFIGFSFIFDSFLTIVFVPIFIILLESHAILEEKYILIPFYGNEYLDYKKKTPFRLVPRPYSYVFIILAVVIVYIGFYNFILKN